MKTDPELGLKIHNHLKWLGIETPTTKGVEEDAHEKFKKIRNYYTLIMDVMGLDLSDDSLKDTPSRVSKMLVDELTWGLDYQNFPKCTVVENKMKYDEMVVEKCTVNSLCEHHFVYFGSVHNSSLGCWIAYIPKEKIIGLSKLSRIARFFSARPQIQERLVEQIAETLKFILETPDVAVLIKAQHFCVITRGVEDSNAYTVTSRLSGAFKEDPDTRNEFLSITKV